MHFYSLSDYIFVLTEGRKKGSYLMQAAQFVAN